MKNIINLCSLISVQVSNVIFPILIFPYVLVKIGVDFYADIALSQTAALYIQIFVIYGFDILGVQKVMRSQSEGSGLTVSEEFSIIFYCRLAIFFACILFASCLYIFCSHRFFIMFLFWSLIPASYIFQASFLFLGLEKNFIVALITFVTRIVGAFAIFCLVHSPQQAYEVPLYMGMSYFIGGLISLYYAMVKFDLKFCFITFRQLVSALNEGKEIFFGNVAVILYRDSGLIIMGMLSCSATAISVFSISNKIIVVLQAVARPLNQFFFPKALSVLRDLKKPGKEAWEALTQKTWPQLFILGSGALLALCSISYILPYISLDKHSPLINQAIRDCVIMTLGMFCGIGNFMYGTVGLNYLSARKYLAISMSVTGIVTFLVCIVLVYYFSDVGASISFVFAEAFLLILIAIKYLRPR